MTFTPSARYSALQLATLLLLLTFSTSGRASLIIADRPSSELSEVIWQSNSDSEPWASAKAQRGGISRQPLLHFPPNIRRAGPQTPHSFSSTLNSLQLPLIARHPQDSRWIPMLASRWLVAEQAVRLYFELDAEARWSDGAAVTTDDIRFTLEFLSAPKSGAAWQAKRLHQLVRRLEVFDQQRFAFVLHKPASTEDIHELASLRPFAAHVYRNARGWPKSFDWYPEPTTGPYYLAQLNPGTQIVLRQTGSWWGQDKPYFRHRFNVRRVNLRMPDNNHPAIQLLERGELDVMPLNTPENWHSPAARNLSKTKRVDLIQFHHQAPMPFSGLFLNADNRQLSRRSQRTAILRSLNMTAAMTALDDASPLEISFLAPAKPLPLPADTGTAALPKTLTLLYSDNLDLAFLRLLQQQAALHGLNLILEQVSPAELKRSLHQADYELAWLRFSSALNENGFLSLFRPDNGQLFIKSNTIKAFMSATGNTDAQQLARHLQDESIFAAGYGYRYSRSASWQWLKLPENHGTRISTDLFDPFDAVSGGMFWIDRKQRADILAKPERGKNDNSEPTINIQYRLNNNQL